MSCHVLGGGVLVEDDEAGVESVLRSASSCQALDKALLAVWVIEPAEGFPRCLEVLVIGVYLSRYLRDFLEAYLRLLVCIGGTVGLRVSVSCHQFVRGEAGGGCCLAELTGHEKDGVTHQPEAVLPVEAEDAGELEVLHRGQPVALPSVQPRELQRLVEYGELPHLVRTEVVGVHQAEELAHGEELEQVVRVRIVDDRTDIRIEPRVYAFELVARQLHGGEAVCHLPLVVSCLPLFHVVSR